MRSTLLRVLLLALLAGVAGRLPARASHLLGGEISYQYLGAEGSAARPYQYRLSLVVYFNADELTSNFPGGRDAETVGIYSRDTKQLLLAVQLPRIQNTLIKPAVGGPCPAGGPASGRVRLSRYEATVTLPAAAAGYYMFFSEAARNYDIINIDHPEGEGMTLYADMAPLGLPNSSPVFSDTAVAVICQGDTAVIINNAFDPDGDRLEYAFGTPYGGLLYTLPAYFTPPQGIRYPSQYSVAQPFGSAPGSYAFLDKESGLSRYASPVLGKYVVAVDVREYRRMAGRDSLIGTTRRDVQLIVRLCEPNSAPVFSTGAAVQEHSVPEGQVLTLTTTATDPEGQGLVLRAASRLLDGANGFDATFNQQPGTVGAPGGPGTVLVAGTGSVSGTFRFAPAYGSARPEPYDLVVTATDDACDSRSAAIIHRIRVVAVFTSTAGPDRTVCPGEATQLGAAPVAGLLYQWSPPTGLSSATVANPTLTLTNSTAAPLEVPYVLTTTLPGVGAQQSTVRVTVQPVPASATISGPARVGSSSLAGVRYSLAGLPGSTYHWRVAGGSITSGQGTGSITVDYLPDASAKAVQVVETSRYGCVGPLLTLPVQPDAILLYNIITPNGDGLNDVFFIENVALYAGSTLTIFDRWGRQVYSARDYRNTWGGANTGPGTHYYVLKLADGRLYKGWFEIVK